MNFEQYKKLQEEHNDWSYNSAWGDQMVEAITEYFKDKPRHVKILDLGCGEGRGVKTLLDMGFTHVLGVDIASNKVKKANENGLPVAEFDFHNLNANFANDEFDYIFCSHAIEHALDPEKVISHAMRISCNGLFICPIDSSAQPEYGTSPHTHNFSSEDQWISLFNKCATTMVVSTNHITKHRLGHEVWSYYES